jgi:hypothetical protein
MTALSLPTHSKNTFKVCKITPETAEAWLKANTRNRTLRPQVVAEYARDMASGRWKFNGDSVRISKTGVILDGQHRLHAIVESGVTLEALVISGLEDESQETMDSGRTRRAADVFSLRGEINSTHLSSVVRKAWMWDAGNHRFHQGHTPSRMEMLGFLDEHPEIRRAAELGEIWYRSYRGLPKGIYAVGYYVLSKINQNEALWFFQRVTDGVDLPECHPVLTLRSRILSDRLSNKNVRDYMWLAYCIRAWNATRQDRPLAKIQQNATAQIPMPV